MEREDLPAWEVGGDGKFPFGSFSNCHGSPSAILETLRRDFEPGQGSGVYSVTGTGSTSRHVFLDVPWLLAPCAIHGRVGFRGETDSPLCDSGH
jgi:hypothetical protein